MDSFCFGPRNVTEDVFWLEAKLQALTTSQFNFYNFVWSLPHFYKHGSSSLPQVPQHYSLTIWWLWRIVCREVMTKAFVLLFKGANVRGFFPILQHHIQLNCITQHVYSVVLITIGQHPQAINDSRCCVCAAGITLVLSAHVLNTFSQPVVQHVMLRLKSKHGKKQNCRLSPAVSTAGHCIHFTVC